MTFFGKGPTPVKSPSCLRALPARLLSVLALGAAAVPAVLGGAAAPASAAEDPPVTISYDKCPALPAGATPSQWTCGVLVIPAGTIKIGKIEQPITSPITIVLQNGPDPDTGVRRNFFGSFDSAPMSVPGGVLGVPGTEDIPFLSLKVQTAYVGGLELGQTSGTYSTAMDIRIKVINPLLGDTCYIGTKDQPVHLKALADPSTLKFYTSAIGATFNDTTFSVPATSGCGLLGGIADWRSGLPSASGGNSASLQGYLGSKSYASLPS